MNSRTIGPVLVNGDAIEPAEAAVSVFDIGFQRGYGCFEAARSYGGKVFRLDRHIDRLANSARTLRIGLPDRSTLIGWGERVGSGGDGVLRMFVTGGTDAKSIGTGSAVIAFLEPLPELPSSIRLDLVEAPWHVDGHPSELAGAKTLSYGPNLAATVGARARGFDDAALFGRDGTVLEGPTFSLGWVTDGTVFTPGLERHILASITREATLDVCDRLGVPAETGQYSTSDLLGATEVFVMSTVREVMPVVAVDGIEFAPGPLTATLREGFRDLVAMETA